MLAPPLTEAVVSLETSVSNKSTRGVYASGKRGHPRGTRAPAGLAGNAPRFAGELLAGAIDPCASWGACGRRSARCFSHSCFGGKGGRATVPSALMMSEIVALNTARDAEVFSCTEMIMGSVLASL